MLILGIETSCDETAAAVVRDGAVVLSNVIASQHELHAEYGGVVPEIASRAHAERLLPVVRRAVDEAGVMLGEIDAVAVGNRPGLIGALVVGVSGAKAMAWGLGVPIVGVDHVVAHLYAPMLRGAAEAQGHGAPPGWAYPALGLVVSGGHTALYRCEGPLAVRRLGSTIDDAVGECYDKVAAILGLEHPGGPKVDALAQRGNDRAHDFPVSRLGRESLEFSFSGLKTAVLYAVRGVPRSGAHGPRDEASARGLGEMDDRARADVCASFQRAAIGALVLKLERALEQWEGEPARSIIVGGGVSANSRLRREVAAMGERRGLRVLIPAMAYCLDNAAMIAGLAWQRLRVGEADDLMLAASPSGARGV